MSKKNQIFVEAKTKFYRKCLAQGVGGEEVILVQCFWIDSLLRPQFTVIRNFLGFVFDLQCLFHDCNHYQDENKEQIVKQIVEQIVGNTRTSCSV